MDLDDEWDSFMIDDSSFDERVSWLSWEVSCEDNYDYDISWANMRRIA